MVGVEFGGAFELSGGFAGLLGFDVERRPEFEQARVGLAGVLNAELLFKGSPSRA